ncbi:Uncharacterized protein YlxW (UPF0749 family) [Stackebrandtia soli]
MIAAAGVLFTVTATAADGTTLRTDEDVRLRELIPQRDDEVVRLEDRAARLRDEVDALAEAAAGDDEVAAELDRAQLYMYAAGLVPVRGPGVVVSLDDAPRQGDQLPAGATVDDVVVHQQDVQAVVNALWAGGAEAMTIMGVRVVSTTAVRCVGNTLLLHGRVYSPPFVIAAIGNNEAMSNALDASRGVRAFRSAAEAFGLGYSMTGDSDISMPAFDGQVEMNDAKVPR